MKNNKILYTVLIFTLFVCNTLHAQQIKSKTAFLSNQVFYELGGLGGTKSINYERFLVQKNNTSISLRVGLSIYNLTDYTNKINPDFVVPITVNFLYGDKHKLDLGIGNSISSVINASIDSWKPKRRTNLNLCYQIGYRYQTKNNKTIYRVGYSPIFELNKTYKNWLYISIGKPF